MPEGTKTIEVTTRSQVAGAVACPACGADAGEACRGVQRRDGTRKPRKRLHAERWNAYGERQDAAKCEATQRDLEAIARLGKSFS